MNKLGKRILGITLGLALVGGVGVALVNSSSIQSVAVNAVEIIDGRYFICDSTGENALSGEISTGSSPLTKSILEAKPFDFVNQGDNSFIISITENEVEYKLLNNSTAKTKSNTSIRVTDTPVSGLKTHAWEISENSDGKFTVKTNTTESTYRILSCYNKQDWRGYTGQSGDQSINIIEEKTQYKNNFSLEGFFKDICSQTGQGTVTSELPGAWAKAKTQYNSLSATSQNMIKSESSECTALYDLIYKKYSSTLEGIDDFMDRKPQSEKDKSVLGSDATTIIAIVSVVALLSVSAIGGYFFVKKTKHE